MTGLWIPDPTQRGDLAVFAQRALRLDRAAVVRLRVRADGSIGAWVSTGFDVLAGRVVAGELVPSDVTFAAGELLAGLESAGESGSVSTGNRVDSAWRGALPPEAGFVHLDDVPADVLDGIARRGAEVALDSDVLRVSSADDSVGIPMRCVSALAAMGFTPDTEGEVVRVRVLPNWLRIDARYGSVFRRRSGPALLLA